MTVSELLKAMMGAYTAFDAKAAGAFASAFRTRLQRHEGDALRIACDEVLAAWRPRQGQRFPVPADFEEYLPGKLNLPKDLGPKLDLKAHGERKKQLFASWKAGQGQRASNGIPEMMRALEAVAEPIAAQRAWDAQPEPVVLTRKQVFKAQQSALSIKRRELHGLPPKDAVLWWSQIVEIAKGWRLEITPDWWSDEAGKTLNRESRETAVPDDSKARASARATPNHPTPQ